VKPSLAVISVVAVNRYGHPNEDVLQALSRAGAQIMRTDLLGTITIRTDGTRIEVETRGDKWELAHD